MHFTYTATVAHPDFNEEYFRGIVDATDTDTATAKVNNCIKAAVAATSGEVSDDQISIVLTKLDDAVNDTESGVICMSHENNQPIDSGEYNGDKINSYLMHSVACPSVYSDYRNTSYCINTAATGVIRKFDDAITGLSKNESDTVIDDMIYIIDHLPDSKNNVAVMGALAAIAIDFVESAMLKNPGISDEVINRNLRMLDRRLASLYHTAGKFTNKPLRPVAYFYCSSDMVSSFTDSLDSSKPIFIPDNSEAIASRIQFPIHGSIGNIITTTLMSDYENSLMNLFEEINDYLMHSGENTEEHAEEHSESMDDTVAKLSARIRWVEEIIIDHGNYLNKIDMKLMKHKKHIKALKKGRR